MEQDWSPITLHKAPIKIKKITNQSIKYKEDEDEDGKPIKKTLPKDFGNSMQKARLAKGLTQKELAQKLNVKISEIQEYEQGKVTNPNRGFARKIEKALGSNLF